MLNLPSHPSVLKIYFFRERERESARACAHVNGRELGVVALLVAGRRARLVSRRRRVLALAVLALGLAARAAGTLLLPVVLALVVAHRVLKGPLPGVVVPRQR